MGIITPIMENQMEKKIENDMEASVVQVLSGDSLSLC